AMAFDVAPVAPAQVPADSDGDGIADEDDGCPSQAGGAAEHGCAPAPAAPVPPAVEPVPAAEPQPEPAAALPAPVAAEIATRHAEMKEEMVGTQLFKVGTFDLDGSAKPTIANVAKLILEGPPGQRVRVEGFTDSSGPREQNMELSKRRAEVVKQALI